MLETIESSLEVLKQSLIKTLKNVSLILLLFIPFIGSCFCGVRIHDKYLYKLNKYPNIQHTIIYSIVFLHFYLTMIALFYVLKK